VHVDDAFTEWSVRVDPTVDGLSTSGLTSYVAVGSKGAIDYANGYIAVPEAADEYPLTGTAAAIERMNRGEGFGGGVRPLGLEATGGAQIVEADPGAPAPASDLPQSVDPAQPTETIVPGEGVAPGEPAPGKPGPLPPETVEPDPIEPQTVTLTSARQVLVFAPSIDGKEGWLVPAYEFTAGEGEGPVVMAVEGEFLQ
jgi:hypothetical protein